MPLSTLSPSGLPSIAGVADQALICLSRLGGEFIRAPVPARSAEHPQGRGGGARVLGTFSRKSNPAKAEGRVKQLLYTSDLVNSSCIAMRLF